MEKLNVVLVILNDNALSSALSNLNFDNANLVAIVVENGNGQSIQIDDSKIPLISFASMQPLLDSGKNFVWLISGIWNDTADLRKVKKFLTVNGVPEDNIVNFEVSSYISPSWIANSRYVEKYGADFFATGISYMKDGLNLNFIPHTGRAVNLSNSNQDLLQSYLTAKYIFEHVKPGTIKFVLIGLAPYSFRYENAKSFSVCRRNIQYMLALKSPPQNIHDKLLLELVSDNVKYDVANITAEQADLNFDKEKRTFTKDLTTKAIIYWEDELRNLTKKLFPDSVKKNLQILKDYIKLCVDNGVKPVGVVFPFSPIMRKNYSEELLTLFRLAVRQLEEAYDFTFIDLFDLNLGYDCFWNLAHLNLRGSMFASIFLGLQLYRKKILPTEYFCGMNYEYFDMLSDILPKDDYNALMDRVFAESAKKIGRKSKIKVGFVMDNAAMWCGDKLYNYFANDERFEATVFLCLQRDKANVQTVVDDFQRGVAKFKEHGINIVGISDPKTKISNQDIIFFLRPYFDKYADYFQKSNLTAETLVIHIPYGPKISHMDRGSATDYDIYRIIWKGFFETQQIIKGLDGYCKLGMPCGIYSGLPRFDVYFEDKNLKFNWKMTRPDAKKIIWAPHWSINGGVYSATFQWNFKFMYEFAKNHPETSWIVKPHPHLLHTAVETGVFPSVEAFQKYLDDWKNLPNAQVATGGYYQEIFLTSDAMIQDSISFIAEYQYVDKPMIFLTRDGEKFIDLGEEILKASYLVDGRDFQEISALIEEVIIKGNDTQAAARKKVFDDKLNYFKHNHMTASEFIFKHICKELGIKNGD